MDGINFVWTLSVGHVVNIFVILTGGIGSFFLLKYNVQAIGDKLESIENAIGDKIVNIENSILKFDIALTKQTEILIAVARQDEQIKSLTEQIRDLRQHKPA